MDLIGLWLIAIPFHLLQLRESRLLVADGGHVDVGINAVEQRP